MAGVLSQNLLRYPSQACPDEVPPVLDTLASPLERTPHCRYHRCPASALAPLLLESESELVGVGVGVGCGVGVGVG